MRFWPLGPTCATGGSAPRESSVPSSMPRESVVKSRARNCKRWKMRRERADKRCHDVEPWERAYMRRSCQEEMLRETARICHDVTISRRVKRYLYIMYMYVYIYIIYTCINIKSSISSYIYIYIIIYMYVSISSTYVYFIMNINHH